MPLFTLKFRRFFLQLIRSWSILSFGEKIRFFAKKNFGSLTALSEQLGMNLPDLHRYITGRVEPKKTFFAKMLTLGCDINWLLSESEEDLSVYKVSESNYEYKAKNLQKENEELKEEIEVMKEVIQESIKSLNNISKTKQTGKGQ